MYCSDKQFEVSFCCKIDQKFMPTSFARHKCQVNHNIKQGGHMTEDSGQQASYGVPYELLPNLPASTSKNPTHKTIKKMEQQTQLRLDVKRHNPSLSCVQIS
jgi:hypothetical protein